MTSCFDDAQVRRLLSRLSELDEDAGPKLLEVIAAVDDPKVGADIARNASFGLTGDAFDLSVGVTRAALRESPEVAAARSFLEEVLGPIDSEDIVAMLDSIDEAIVSGRSLNLAERNGRVCY